MDPILAAPEFQSAIAPFAAALVALVLLPRGDSWSGLGVGIGFLASVLLINGLTLEPLTGTRKIMLLVLIAAPLSLLLERAARGRVLATLHGALAAGAVLWVLWGVLARKSGIDLLLLGGGGLIYVLWLTLALQTLAGQPLRAGGAALALALATGVCALLGASALLGQLGMALGAACGAYLLLAAFSGAFRAGPGLVFGAALGAGLIGYAGLAFARLPWFALPVLALVPLAARVPLPQRLPRPLRAGLAAAGAAAPGAAAVLVVLLGQDGGSGY